MESRIPRHKGIYILPNLFTTASLFAGFMSILWASQGTAEGYSRAALAIFFSALMDGLDGKVARLTNTNSEFGVQYDSLADLVAFGVAPAFLMFGYALHNYHRLGVASAFLFTVCAALRLARFNISTATINKRFFIGLPTPAAGCSLACLVVIAPSLPLFLAGALNVIVLLFTVLIAFLMVSRIRYASFKEFGFFKAHPFRTMVFIIALFAMFVVNPKLFISLTLFGYLVSGLAYTFFILPRLSRAANRASQSMKNMPESDE